MSKIRCVSCGYPIDSIDKPCPVCHSLQGEAKIQEINQTRAAWMNAMRTPPCPECGSTHTGVTSVAVGGRRYPGYSCATCGNKWENQSTFGHQTGPQNPRYLSEHPEIGQKRREQERWAASFGLIVLAVLVISFFVIIAK